MQADTYYLVRATRVCESTCAEIQDKWGKACGTERWVTLIRCPEGQTVTNECVASSGVCTVLDCGYWKSILDISSRPLFSITGVPGSVQVAGLRTCLRFVSYVLLNPDKLLAMLLPSVASFARLLGRPVRPCSRHLWVSLQRGPPTSPPTTNPVVAAHRPKGGAVR